MMGRKVSLLWTILAGIAMAVLAPSARADFELAFNVGGATGQSVVFDANAAPGSQVVVYNNGVVVAGGAFTNATTGTFASQVFGASTSTSGSTTYLDIAKTLGANSVLFTLDGFTISYQESTTNSPGSPLLATIATTSTTLTNTTGGTLSLNISTTSTGFTAPKGPNATLTSTASATAGGNNSSTDTLTYNSYLDTTNANFGMQQTIAPISLSVPKGASSSANVSGLVNAAITPYSVTDVVTATLAGGDQFTDISGETDVRPTPAPPALVLLLSALPVGGLSYLRRMRSKRSAA